MRARACVCVVGTNRRDYRKFVVGEIGFGGEGGFYDGIR